MPRIHDLSGRRFGRLLVTKFSGRYGSGKSAKRLWLCACDCGNTVSVRCGALLSGNSTSCGCKTDQARRSRKHAIVYGNEYGWLTAIRETARRTSRFRYVIFRCRCGTEKEIIARNVANGKIVSCGCKPRGGAAPSMRSEYHRLHARAYNAKRRAPSPSGLAGVITAMQHSQGNRCALCGSDGNGVALELDHIVPVILGGTNDPKNLQLLCRFCNRSKGVKLAA